LEPCRNSNREEEGERMREKSLGIGSKEKIRVQK
jgi:hypothetical protein